MLSSIDRFSTAVFRTFEHGNVTKVSMTQENIGKFFTKNIDMSSKYYYSLHV